MASAIVSCQAQGTLSISLRDYYVQNCATDRSVCNSNDYSYDNCECAEGASSATSICPDGCSYLFGDGLSVQRATSAGVTESILNIGSVPTPSHDILIGFTHTLFGQGNNQPKGKITVGFTPLPPHINSNAPALGGNFYSYFNDQNCDIQQIWCDEQQTTYNFLIDCSMYEGGAVVNMCQGAPTTLSEQSSVMELALWGPFMACQDASFAWTPSPAPAPASTSGAGASPAGTGGGGGGGSGGAGGSLQQTNGNGSSGPAARSSGSILVWLLLASVLFF